MPQPTIGGEPATDQSLIGAGGAGVASSAFERLSQAVQESVPAPVASDPGPLMGNGKTLEDLVKEMLRPMLKEWLDRNLPPMVERFVEREIVRLTRR
jgi:cell pole-organizing protein PopZ